VLVAKNWTDVLTSPRVGGYRGQCMLNSLEFVDVGLCHAVEDGVGVVKPRINHCTSNMSVVRDKRICCRALIS